ncbi:uncharacterized protein G2W53_044996 [Senna tora]|uniref:Uncharacterized protein n=1 Tax=Senna tora TaxID=362788 RepID=A0A834SMS0_9FABA|nr:uncharacterized protein G2W53_044996 [Senna tora]
MGAAWIMSQHISDEKLRSDLINLHELRYKTLVAQESETRRFALYLRIESGFDAPIGVVMEWEKRGSCLNIFRMTNRDRLLEIFTNYEAKDLLRKNLHELRGKTLVAQLSETGRFALYLRTRVVLMLQLETSWHGRSVDDVLTYSRRQIAVRSEKPSRITMQKTCYANEKSRSDHINPHELQGKTLVVQVSETCRFALYLQTGVVLMLKLKSSWHGRGVDHVLTYSGRQIAVASQKPSRISIQHTCCASV